MPGTRYRYTCYVFTAVWSPQPDIPYLAHSCLLWFVARTHACHVRTLFPLRKKGPAPDEVWTPGTSFFLPPHTAVLEPGTRALLIVQHHHQLVSRRHRSAQKHSPRVNTYVYAKHLHSPVSRPRGCCTWIYDDLLISTQLHKLKIGSKKTEHRFYDACSAIRDQRSECHVPCAMCDGRLKSRA